MSEFSLFRENYAGQSTDSGYRVDRENCVVHNVKILGWKSRNKRRYVPEGVDAALYEGCFVNVDHPVEAHNSPVAGLPVDRALQGRSVRSRFARLTGVKKKADGLYAEQMICNPENSYTKEFLWWAENHPDAVVLSHLAAGPRRMEKDGSCTVLGIKFVSSVDVVGTGGTNVSLAESANEMNENVIPLGEFLLGLFPEATVEDVKAKITKALEQPADFKGDVNAALEALKDSADPRVKLLVESLNQKLDEDALESKREQAETACKTAKLPENVVSAVFIEQLVNLDPVAWPALIEDRKKLIAPPITRIKSGNPLPQGVKTADDFVKGFRSRN